jgi:putative transferase (TIGR04331 family)
MKKKIHLVTNSNFNTWDINKLNLLLGEWCFLYTKQNIINNYNYEILIPKNNLPVLKENNFLEVNKIENDLFNELYVKLNEVHNINFNARSWRIIIGHWLKRYVNALYNRIKTIENTIEEYDITSYYSYSKENFQFCSKDSYSAIWNFNDDELNSILYRLILEEYGFYKTKIVSNNNIKTLNFKVNQTYNFKYFFLIVFSYISKFFQKEKWGIIINSYLPKVEEIKLQFKLRQFPILWSTINFKSNVEADLKNRKNISNTFSKNKTDILNKIIYKYVFEFLPICYLESFQELNETTLNCKLPESPKFIFTSNNFDTDEIFKLYVAKKIKIGTKYIVGQHGNNYGTHKYLNPTIEEITTDKFLTWGWNDKLKSHVDTFIFKTIGKKKTYNKNGKILLIQDMPYHRINFYDNTYEYVKYLKDQIKFYNNLSNNIKSLIELRLHSSSKLFNFYEKERWLDNDKSMKINYGEIDLFRTIKNSRIVIFTYDSTGLLETLSLNIPTLIYINNNLEFIRESAMEYYQMLIDVGILFTSYYTISDKINQIYENVDEWWNDENVQNARKTFCNKYARTINKPLIKLKNILQN